jgi:crooked neck
MSGRAATQVKNKSPSSVQITADQILREAQAHREVDPKPPQQKITDMEELQMYRCV